MPFPSGQSTIGVWAGEEGEWGHDSAHLNIVQRIAFDYANVDEWGDVVLNRRPGHIYSRNTNPTVEVFEEKLRQLEGAEAATSFATGMAAISNTLLALVKPGKTIVSITDTYGGTNRLFTEFLPDAGITVKLCNTQDDAALEQAIAEGCDLLYLETPTNPTMKIVDIAKFAALGHAAGAIVVVDSTVATPINQSPLLYGVDLVVHSASKYLGGHGDALGGVICGREDLVSRVFRYREINGASLDPFAAYLLARGMKTLDIRVERHNKNALAIALYLKRHELVNEVYYPGLTSHPKHNVAAKQMRGFGGMLSFTLRGGEAAVKTFLNELRCARRAASLGHVETVVGTPAMTSHVECTLDQRAAMGIPEALVRYSVGIEDVSDLIRDLDEALTVTAEQAATTPL